jgi:5-phospho-D-xylono-1,4-lactonase
MSFVRTVLGDIPAGELGFCYAHEHIIIDGPFVKEKYPEFKLDSVNLAANELAEAYSAGVRAMVDAMPIDAGRDAAKLAEVSRRTGIHIVCPTGLHLALYYEPDHWSAKIDLDALTDRFVSEIEDGVVDGVGPTAFRAGVIKVASGLNTLGANERRNLQAAARAQAKTGCPILTHTEQGTAALEQVETLRENGADVGHVVLSHLDRTGDVGYHREVLSTGVALEYDSAFRWGEGVNQTLELILQLLPEFPNQVVLGMDAARRSYWKAYGGKPGLTYLARHFTQTLREHGLSQADLDRIFVANPANYYSFKEVGSS